MRHIDSLVIDVYITEKHGVSSTLGQQLFTWLNIDIEIIMIHINIREPNIVGIETSWTEKADSADPADLRTEL